MKNGASIESQNWDKYWSKKKNNTQMIYDKIAEFYRIFIIKRALNHFIETNFRKGSTLLHTGSGTGQVDTDLVSKYKITGVDVSKVAINLYKETNGNKSKLIQSDVKKIPVKPNSYDGIYNLGLMEHFDRSEIDQILKEFHRILKANGKIIFFWPPVFGSSVITLKLIHIALNAISSKKVKLHPDEISLIKSRTQVNQTLKENGFKMTKFYFGPRDMFTHCIIVARKAPTKR